MKKQFYSHLIETVSLTEALQSLELTTEEHKHLEMLIESTIHHEVIDAILSHLSDADKRTFLKHLASDEHDKVWEHLMNKVESVEDKIKKAAEALTKDLHTDIENSK
jgi:hypothetical protein